MSLLSWFPLNGDTLNYGISKMSLAGSPTFVNGKTGKALSNRLQIQNNGTFSDSSLQDFSVALWVGNNSSDYIMACTFFEIASNASRSFFRIGPGGTGSIYCGAPNENMPELTSWMHLAGTWNRATKTVKFYVNGVQQGSVTVDFMPVQAMVLTFNLPYNGTANISDLRFYDHCLSPLEVKLLSQGLVVHYPLNLFDGNVIGRNYMQGVLNACSADSKITTSVTNGVMRVEFTDSSGNWNWCCTNYLLNARTSIANNFATGETYTFSFDLLIESGQGIPSFYLCSNNGYYNCQGVSPTLTGVWLRCYTTLQMKETDLPKVNMYFGWYSCKAGVYYIKNLKMEKGSIPTPYTLAPEQDTSLNTATIYDCSGWGNNATFQNLSLNSGPFANSLSTYCNNNGTTFDGWGKSQASYILGNLQLTNPESITFAFWANIEAYNRGGILTTYKQASWFDAGNIHYNDTLADCDGAWRLYSPNGYIDFGPKRDEYVNTGWHHFAITYGNSTGTFYVDGELVQTGSLTGPLYSCETFSIGTVVAGGMYRKARESVSDFRIYCTALSADDIKALYKQKFLADNGGNLYCGEVKEWGENLLAESGVTQALLTGTLNYNLSFYEQTNCKCSFVNGKARVYRTPNVNPTDNGNSMWGGLRLRFIDKLTEGHTYVFIVHAEGKSSGGNSLYFASQMGWGNSSVNPKPSDVESVKVSSGFNGDAELYYKFTINDSLMKTCTVDNGNSAFVVGTEYPSYCDFCIGWSYENTGADGTDIYFSNFRLYDITNRVTSGKMNSNGILEALDVSECDGSFRIVKSGTYKTNEIKEL